MSSPSLKTDFRSSVSLSAVFSFAFSLVLVLPFLLGCDGADTAVVDQPKGKVAGTVDLEINFNSDKRTISASVPCSADSTVFTVLERAQNLGDVKFESRGSGETAFVNSIGGVENAGASGDNWVYRVNGELGDKSCGVYSVKPGDKIEWRFGKYPE
ncbi:MAG: DUF4430 domain-containing protein [Mariniblastus sp.]